MLTIRQEQMEAFEEETQRQFETRMEAYLRGAYPSKLETTSDQQLLGLIRQGVANSEKYDVVTENDVSRYIAYMVSYGADFDRTQPWAAKILKTPQINGTQKMDRIDNYDLFAGRGGGG